MTMTEEEAAQRRKEHQEWREALKQAQELLHVALLWVDEWDRQKMSPPACVNPQ
jgi:hypothetical protein